MILLTQISGKLPVFKILLNSLHNTGFIKYLDINIYSFIILSKPIALSRFNLVIHKFSSFSSNDGLIHQTQFQLYHGLNHRYYLLMLSF